MFRPACLLRSLWVVAAIGIVTLPQAALRAQTAEQAQQIVAALPAPTHAVIDRLSSLHELPDGVWKQHSGDLAHGEAVALDQSGWTAIKPGEKASNDAIWLRQTFTVPKTLNGYDLTGARIWFQIHVYANGPMPEILYFNGRRVALGDDLEPVVLFDAARPGETVVVAVKLLHTVDQKNFRGATMKIDFPESRPNPEDLWKEFLSAALLVPALAPNDPAKLATLTSAIEAVDLKALDASDQTKFDASLRTARTKLDELKPLLQQVMLHLTGNSHIDAAWLWPWTETVDVVKRTFSTALQLMYEYPHYTYSQSAAAFSEWMADKYPDINAEIARRIKEGRWEIVGGMWVEPDLNMPDGESLVRQLLVGKRWFRQNYGVDVRIGWNPDSFGYTWQLPQIYKKSGIDYFVTQKMAWCDTNQLPFKFFWWESPDGSKVLSYFPHDYANDNLNPVRLARDYTIAQKQATGLPAIMDLYGVGDHGGGPTRAILDEGEHWAAPGHVFPQMKFGTAQSYFSEFEKKIAPESPVWDYRSIAKGYTAPPAVAGMVSIPTWKSELYFEYHRGVMTTQANHKKNMREAEVNVLDAEKFSSLAWILAGRAYPTDELNEDWKKVLFNQFHDTAAGSGIGVIYKDAAKDYDVVRFSTKAIDAEAQTLLNEKIDTRVAQANGVPVVVYNSLGWERSGNVQVRVAKAGKFEDVTLHVNKVPAFGYAVVEAGDTKEEKAAWIKLSEAGNSISLENTRIRVTVDKTSGCISSLKEKGAKEETIASGACGNQLQFFKDTPKQYDAWNVDPGTFDAAPATIEKADSVEKIGDAIRITSHYQNSKFVQTLRLEGDQIDVENDIDWHESHVLLKAAFPLAATSDFATYEIPYGTIDRPTTRNTSWEKAQFEVPAMRWADLGGKDADGKVHGLSVINNSKYGYDAVGNLLRLTLLRSPKWPDPEADMGHHHFHYALYPHAGTWKEALTVRHGYEFNYPLTAVVTTAHAGALPPSHSFISVGPENVVLTAVKKAEDAKGLILRMYEWAGKDSTTEIKLPAGATGATVTNMQETPEGAALKVEAETLRVPIHPYEILTVRVDYPNGGPKE
jgi:alpha-mannosidase